MVEVLTWGQAWPEGRATAHQVEHSVGLALLEGQLPSHHGVEDDTSGGMGFLGTAPPPLPRPLHPPPRVLEPLGWRSQAPQVSLLPVVLLAHEDLWGCVGHRAAEGAQQCVLEPGLMGKAKVCKGHAGRVGRVVRERTPEGAVGDCKCGCGQLLGAGLIGGLKDKADWDQKSEANQCRGWSPGLEPQQD